MKKQLLLMSAFLLINSFISEFSSAQNAYNQNTATQNIKQPGDYAIQSKIQNQAGSNKGNAAAVNPREGNLSSFMRDSASGEGLGKYLTSNTSKPAGTNYQPYFSSSQVMTSMSRNNTPASNPGTSINTVTPKEPDVQVKPGSDDISLKLANITEQLNNLQQKMDAGGYNKNSASPNNNLPFMSGARKNEITSTSEMFTGADDNQAAGYQKNKTSIDSYLQNASSASSRLSQPPYQSNNTAGMMTQDPASESLNQIKAKLDEMSKSIDAHLQTPRQNPMQYQENNPPYKPANSSPRIEEQLTSFQSYSQLQFEKYFRAAQEQLRLGNFFQAADSFTLASIYEPDNSPCYAGHGHALFAAGQFVSSALYIIRAIELNPEYIQANIDLVTITGGRDITASRIAELEQLLKKAPASGLQFLTAYVYYRTGQLAEARQIINAACQDMPNSRAALALKIAIDTKLNN